MHARRKEMEGSRGEWRVLLAAALVVASVTLLGAEDVTTSAPIEFQLASTYDAPGVKSGTLLEATGDETLDLVLATGGAYALLEGGGDGTFQQRSVTRTRNSTGWGLHDFNGDGWIDLFLSQDGPDVLLSNGDGTFGQVELGLEGEGVVRTALIADYDGDGAADVYLSTSAFSQTHAWNRLHPGLPDGSFGEDIIDTILQPAISDFWHAYADGPEGCSGEWSAKQFKGAVVRDFDSDGKPDIVATAYADRGYQDPDCERWAQGWVEEQQRGVFVLRNISQPGMIRFEEVAMAAIGPEAYGASSSDWNPYHATPLDFDRDGDLDVFVGAVIRGSDWLGTEDTAAVRLLENVSTPGMIRFVDRTDEAGFGYINAPDPAKRRERSLAAAAPFDVDNDGWVDLVAINRRDADRTTYGYVHVFRNEGDGTFQEVPAEIHGMADGAGGRDLTYGDLNSDGLLDLVVMDGSVGGYEGMNNTRVYLNATRTDHHWLDVEVATNAAGSPAIGAKISVFDADSGMLLGYQELRTDFSYRCKRPPVLHFGLGETEAADVVVEYRGETILETVIAVDRAVVVSLADQMQRRCLGSDLIEHRDIAYASFPGVDPNALSVDVYEPVREAGCPGAPVLVYVHGGGWAKGDKSAVGEKADCFTQAGYVFVSANYRMTPQVQFPVHAEDVARAIAWVVEHLDEYGGDPDRIFLMGHSAGAHLVSLLATDGRYLASVGLGLNALSGVVSNDTQAYDIAWLAEQQGGSLMSVYADTFGADPSFWSFASPLHYIEPEKPIAPFLLLVSRGSSPFGVNPQRLEAANTFAQALRAAGVHVEVLNAPEKTHSQINQQIGEPGDDITQAILAFLEAAVAD